MNYRFCLIGVKDTTINIAEYLCEHIAKPDCIITIDETAVKTETISGFSSITDFAEKEKIQTFRAKNYSMLDDESRAFFSQNSFELGICVGWQRLIPKYILDAFTEGIFGFHGSCAYLPYGRGRSPLNWSIIKGDKRFILNMFKYDETADSPNVFTNRMFEINEYDTIRTLQYKNLLCNYEMIKELWDAFIANSIHISTETKDFNSVYPKRTPKDGKIDFSARTSEIYNLIRGVSKPFPGAFAFVNNSGTNSVVMHIWDAVPFDSIIDFSRYRVGEIIQIYDNQPIVRTLDGSIIIKDYECQITLKKGFYLN